MGVRGGTLPMPTLAAGGNWDPHIATGLFDLVNFAPIYSSIIEYNPETDDALDIRGELASDWTVSDDGITYTFNIVTGVRFIDGETLDANDVVFSLDRMVENGKRAGQFSSYFDSARVVDNNTVEVTLQFATPLFISILANEYVKVLPQHVVEAGTDVNVAVNAVGSGTLRLRQPRAGCLPQVQPKPCLLQGRPTLCGRPRGLHYPNFHRHRGGIQDRPGPCLFERLLQHSEPPGQGSHRDP